MQTNSQYVKNGLVIETPQYPNWSIGSLSNNDGHGFENVN